MYFKETNIHLILCGSTISMMHSEILNYSAPLYGRSTSIIHLKPLLAHYIHDFVPNLSTIEFMDIYASFGTIPKYLEMYKKEQTFKENVTNILLNKNSFLYNEGYFLLKQEINDVSTYFSILEAISKGATKLGNISKMLEMQSSQLTRYIEKLIALGFIDKEIPITEKNPLKSKLGRYRFKDNFLKFWFFYVYKNYRYLEIDLLAFDEKRIVFIECKWRNKKVNKSVFEALKVKSELIESSLENSYVIFSKVGCSEALEGEDIGCFVF